MKEEKENTGGIRMEEDDEFSCGPDELGCCGPFSNTPSRKLGTALGSFSGIGLGIYRLPPAALSSFDCLHSEPGWSSPNLGTCPFSAIAP